MDQTFHTLIHVGAKSEIDELAGLRKSLSTMLGKEFTLKSDTDYSCMNKVIAENIDLKIPSHGEVVKRLVELAQERNINYIPSSQAAVSLNDYCALKAIPNPLSGKKSAPSQAPVYNPVMPAPIIAPPMDPQAHFGVGAQMYNPPPMQGYPGQQMPPPGGNVDYTGQPMAPP